MTLFNNTSETNFPYPEWIGTGQSLVPEYCGPGSHHDVCPRGLTTSLHSARVQLPSRCPCSSVPSKFQQSILLVLKKSNNRLEKYIALIRRKHKWSHHSSEARSRKLPLLSEKGFG